MNVTAERCSYEVRQHGFKARLRRDAIQEGLHVLSNVRVGVLVDREGRGCVLPVRSVTGQLSLLRKRER